MTKNLVLLVSALALSACGSSGIYNRPMSASGVPLSPGAQGAIYSGRQGVAIGQEIAASASCPAGQVMTSVESDTRIRSGSDYSYDNQRTRSYYGSRNRSSGYRPPSRVFDPVEEEFYSRVDNNHSFRCVSPEDAAG